MKRLLCLLLTLMLLIPAALCEDAAYVTRKVAFEDGFTLEIPSDWVSFALDPALTDSGFIYCLGSADAEKLMYIQRWPADASTLDELRASIEDREEIKLHESDASADGDFIFYSFVDSDASGCMTLFDGAVLNFIFQPQSDPSTMLIAAFLTSTAEF